MERLNETPYCESNNHVDNITWPQKVEVITQCIWSSVSQQPCKIHVRLYWLPIGNCTLQVQWSHVRWRHVTSKGQGHDPKILRFSISYLYNHVDSFVDATSSESLQIRPTLVVVVVVVVVVIAWPMMSLVTNGDSLRLWFCWESTTAVKF